MKKLIIKGWVSLQELIEWVTEEMRQAANLEDNDPRFWKGYAAALKNVIRRFNKDEEQR